MFFRRERPKPLTFADRLERLRQAGFSVSETGAGAHASRGAFAVELKDEGGQARPAGRAGIHMGDETGVLIDEGYQKFFRTPSGRKKPALAGDLQGLHNFAEDLKEALGLESLYNESLGTVSTYYIYDRVQDRDRGAPKRVWE